MIVRRLEYKVRIFRFPDANPGASERKAGARKTGRHPASPEPEQIGTPEVGVSARCSGSISSSTSRRYSAAEAVEQARGFPEAASISLRSIRAEPAKSNPAKARETRPANKSDLAGRGRKGASHSAGSPQEVEV